MFYTLVVLYSQVVGDTIKTGDHVLFKVKPGNTKYKKNNEAVNLINFH